MDDYRDIGAQDFERYEKIREEFPEIVEALNLVTNSSSGTLQIDPVQMVQMLLPGHFARRDLNVIQDTETVAGGGSQVVRIPREDEEDTATLIHAVNLIYTEETTVLVSIDAPFPGTDASTPIGAISLNAPSAVGQVVGSAPGSPSLPVATTEYEQFRCFRSRVLSPGTFLTIQSFTIGAVTQDLTLNALYSNQPPGLPYTNPSFA
jgi:hypothetical protein